jgi:hypothetical protein
MLAAPTGDMGCQVCSNLGGCLFTPWDATLGPRACLARIVLVVTTEAVRFFSGYPILDQKSNAQDQYE